MPLVMDADRMARALTRMAHEILERNRGLDEIALVGIRTRGVPLARRISRSLHDINGDDVPTGALRQILRGHTSAVPALAFTDDGKILASGDVGGAICVWRIGMPQPTCCKPEVRFAQHSMR